MKSWISNWPHQVIIIINNLRYRDDNLSQSMHAVRHIREFDILQFKFCIVENSASIISQIKTESLKQTFRNKLLDEW